MEIIKKYGHIIAIIIPIIIFVYFFYNQQISNNSEDWSYFATYFSAFISLANLIVFITLTQRLNRYNQEKDQQAEIYKKQIDRPILSFVKKTGNSYYDVVNIGNGAALNVVIKGSLFFDIWNDAFLYYSLNKEQSIPLSWATNSVALAAEYEDIFGKNYFSFMDNDRLRFFEESGEDDKYKTERKTISFPTKNAPTWP